MTQEDVNYHLNENSFVSLPTLYYNSEGLIEYSTVCEVESNLPVVPEDPLRFIPRKRGVAMEAFINNNWIRIGVISKWHQKKGDIQLKCIRPHPYEIPIKVTIRRKQGDTQSSIFEFFEQSSQKD